MLWCNVMNNDVVMISLLLTDFIFSPDVPFADFEQVNPGWVSLQNLC